MGIPDWLRSNGFNVVENTDAGIVLQIRPPKALVEESDRVMKMLQDEYSLVFDPVNGAEDGMIASIHATYDPITGDAFVTITAI